MKIFVSLIYDEETQVKLNNFYRSLGLDLTKDYDGREIDSFEFHTTIFYTDTNGDFKNLNKKVDIENVALFYEMLGEDLNVPVLRVNSKELQELRLDYEIKGLTDPWPDYRPHMSITYNMGEYQRRFILNLPLPPFKLRADRLVQKIDTINESLEALYK